MTDRLPFHRAAWRGGCVTALLALALVLALLVALSLGRLRPEPLAAWWLRRLLTVLHIDVVWHGTREPGARMLVANHVSWLDIAVIGSRMPARFIAKREVRDWPLIGWLAQAAGTFFIRRGAGGAKSLVERLQPHMRGGGLVVLFPEGTTTDGRDVARFHARLFDAAVATESAVQPLALRYGGAHGAGIAPFIGDDTFVRHLGRVLRCPGMRVDATLPPGLPPGADRAALCREAHTRIRDIVLGDEHPGHRTVTAAAAARGTGGGAARTETGLRRAGGTR